jgi:o-succinylbenzoate synthase
MGLRASYQKYTLKFTFDAGTSRGVLTEKDTYFVKITNQSHPETYGLGECSPLKGLSIDDLPDYESYLSEICANISRIEQHPYAWPMQKILTEYIGNPFPSIQFGFETALLDLQNGGRRAIFSSPFYDSGKGIEINGLIWMGDEAFMRRQIDKKLAQGFRCLKLKIGAIDFDRECALLAYIRQRYPADQVTIRVDANGAFAPGEALEKLNALSRFQLHSIEQPIRAGNRDAMSELCRQTPLPIALDEELVGVMEPDDKQHLLQTINPQFIILKPSLLGGFIHCKQWIELANRLQIGWWITSALESNVALNAISQFTAVFGNAMPQGLGTGQLYHNNIPSPLEIRRGHIYYNAGESWDLSPVNELVAK